MRSFIFSLVAVVIALSGAQAFAGNFSGFSGFSGGGSASTGSVAASGFVNGAQGGSWSVGAMTESYGTAGVEACSRCGVNLSTSGGSMTEGFGSNFRGVVGSGGAGFGQAEGGVGFRSFGR